MSALAFAPEISRSDMRLLLHSYFEDSAKRSGRSVALRSGGKDWSYDEILATSQKIECMLTSAALYGRQRTVGVLSDKCITAYVALLGIMASGNIYVPLSPKLPIDRLAYMVESSAMAAIIVPGSLVEIAIELQSRRLRENLPVIVDDGQMVEFLDHSQVFDSDTSNLSVTADKRVAYLLFTSGTTGLPKGVPVKHKSASACIASVTKQLEFFGSDRFTQFSDLSFDVSIAEMFLCWRAGACLCIPQPSEVVAPLKYVNRERITVWSSVPTLANNMRMLGLLKPGCLPLLRLSLFCGEAFSATLACEWQSAANSSTVINLYGPTEAAMFSTLYKYSAKEPPDSDILPIGAPLSGFKYRIKLANASTDERKKKYGELILSGPQVFGGYWDDISSSNAVLSSDRAWYSTGDLVSFDSRYGLVFHGRLDHQVKVRGHRVELQEVEVALRKAAKATFVAVVPVYGEGRRCEFLVGFCDSDEEERTIKRNCSHYLPGYMIPARIIRLEQFPLTLNGKIDYTRLMHLADGGFDEDGSP
jgi:D-alanine--poly(phosphoribitol) ligase subunit 1